MNNQVKTNKSYGSNFTHTAQSSFSCLCLSFVVCLASSYLSFWDYLSRFHCVFLIVCFLFIFTLSPFKTECYVRLVISQILTLERAREEKGGERNVHYYKLLQSTNRHDRCAIPQNYCPVFSGTHPYRIPPIFIYIQKNYYNCKFQNITNMFQKSFSKG